MQQQALNLNLIQNPVDTGRLLANARATTLSGLQERVRFGHELTPSEWRLLEKLAGAENGDQVATSMEELAAAMGVTKRTVLRWAKKPGFPVGPAGTYAVEDVRTWRGGGDPARPADAAAPAADSRAHWEREWKKAQAELAALKRERMAGRLIDRATVAREFAARVLAVKNGLFQSIPHLADAVAGVGDRQAAAEVIRAEFRRLVEEYSRPLPPSMTPRQEDAAP